MARGRSDTREHLLEGARRIVSTKGYAAVGINEVLASVGVPKGSFYYYFGSKDAFGDALMQAYFDDYLATMDRIVAQADKTSAQHLAEYWQFFYDAQIVNGCQGECLVVKLGAEIADLSEAMRVTTKSGTTKIVSRIAQMIAAGVVDGSVSIDLGGDPHQTAQELYDLWLGASMMAKIHGNPEQLDRAMAVTRRVLHI
jgi:TetR/AcrR family transcriptional repressor of nem operon